MADSIGGAVGQQFGNYRLIRLLGEGGFAAVYLGEHIHLSTLAAIKILNTRLTGEDLESFRTEARTIARLIHPHIIRVLEFDVQRNIPFLVMDYAPNGTLRQRHPKGVPVPLPTIVSYVKQVAEGLQYAHDQRLIHRDIKPENMLLGRNGEILLSDFGIAMVATTSLSQSVHEVAGTILYMAPEQIQGRPRLASDQYSLGVVVYEWLCGESPFRGSFTEVAAQHALRPPPSLREKIPTISLYVEQVVMTALEKDPHKRFASVKSFATAFEQACQMAANTATPVIQSSPAEAPPARFSTPSRIDLPPAGLYPSNPPPVSHIPGQATERSDPFVTLPDSSSLRTPPISWPHSDKARPAPAPGISRINATILAVLACVIIAASVGALFYFLAARNPATITAGTLKPVAGGHWLDDLYTDPDSLIPGATVTSDGSIMDQALWAPLFYADPNNVIQPGLATRIPTLANGDISPDLTTWTFHLRPNLKWSDGQPLNADDVDFTWRLWTNPQFLAANTAGISLISSADISADKLSITFHLTRPFSPFLSAWVDGINAPLPAHHYRSFAPGQITTSPDNLNPPVTSGPFHMSESKPGDHYTLVRNPNYYQASAGLPYLDGIEFRVVTSEDTILQDLQSGQIDSAWGLDVVKTLSYQHVANYVFSATTATANFEAFYFNFRNPILGKYLEVRQAMAMAVDRQALIDTARRGQAIPLCTDHGPAYNPGFEPNAPCPTFNIAAARSLLDQHGWVMGSDGVRTKDGMRLEFNYTTTTTTPNTLWRTEDQVLLQSDFNQIGIQIDLQNVNAATFFGTLLNNGQASPATGAKPGRYDIAEFENQLTYDPDDSTFFACSQVPPKGINFTFFCDPALDKLFTEEQSTLNPQQRQQIFNAIHQLYLTEFPFVVLYGPTDLAMHKKSVHNYAPGPLGGTEATNIWAWWCDNGQC